MKRHLMLAAAAAASVLLSAQDADLFFASRVQPLLDPSRTGFEPGGCIGLVHQQQWLQMPGTWRHAALSAELSLKNRRRQVNSWIGIGLRAGQGSQKTTGAKGAAWGMVSAAHLRTGPRSFLSAGIGVLNTNVQRGEAEGTWGSQYDGAHFLPHSPSGEEWNRGNRAALEATTGISFTLKQEVESPRRREPNLLVAGVAATHLAPLLLAESGGRLEPTPVRYTAYVLGELPLPGWDNGFVGADLIGQVQGPFLSGRANVWIGKHAYNLHTSAPVGLSGFKAGLGYRLRDALLACIAAEVGPATIGLAYGWSVVGPDKLAKGGRTAEVMLQVRFLEQ